MSEEVKRLESWEEVIVDFFQNKKNAEEEKYLKDIIKKIAKLYEENNYFNNEEIEDYFNQKKSKKSNEQTSIEFQRERLSSIFTLNHQIESIDQNAILDAYNNTLNEIEQKFESHSWIERAAKDASSVTFATHVFKLTHSKIDSLSLPDMIDSQKYEYLTTSMIKGKEIDGAVAGNQFAPVYQFLELQFNGRKLASELIIESSNALESFANDNEELQMWNKKFKDALASNKPSTHSLAKQVYFPVPATEVSDSNNPYHLLANVNSSSLSHAIYLKMSDKQQSQILSLQKKGKYSETAREVYPDKAILMVTQSNHGNASQLNGKRGGRLNLLSTQPPIWQSQLKPPMHNNSFFYAIPYNHIIRENMDYLRDFLLRFERIELSFKDPKKIQWIERWVEQIIDEVFAYVASIQNLPSGWSNEPGTRLKNEHCLFIDPYRKDEAFVALRISNEWQSAVCGDFANWLNYKLKGKEKSFTPQSEHTRLWRELMTQLLREFDEPVEMEIKKRQKERA